MKPCCDNCAYAGSSPSVSIARLIGQLKEGDIYCCHSPDPEDWHPTTRDGHCGDWEFYDAGREVH